MQHFQNAVSTSQSVVTNRGLACAAAILVAVFRILLLYLEDLRPPSFAMCERAAQRTGHARALGIAQIVHLCLITKGLRFEHNWVPT